MERRIILIGLLAATVVSLHVGVAQAQYAAPDGMGPVLSPQVVASINALKPEQARNQHRIHLRRRNIIAAHLNSLWAQERQVKSTIDSSGMQGDMVTVTQQEHELYAVRGQIDTLRAELTKENMILSLLEQRMNVAR